MRSVCQWVLGMMLLSGAASGEELPDLWVKVEGLKSNKGKVVINLFKDSETWLKREKAVQSIGVPAESKDVSAHFLVKPGTYAVSVFHDENDNGKLDMRWLPPGPAEPTVVSNNAKGTMGPPAYKDALFELKGNLTLTLQLQ